MKKSSQERQLQERKNRFRSDIVKDIFSFEKRSNVFNTQKSRYSYSI